MSLIKKIFLGFLATLVVFTGVAGTLFLPTPAKAFPVETVTDLPSQLKDALSNIWEALKSAVLNAATRMVAYVIRKVAYDTAVWLASGGKGQSPFAQTKGFGGYLKDVGNEAFGSAIESLADKRTGIGINLCKIPDIKVDLAMKVGLRMPGFSGFGGGGPSQKPSCSFTEFTKNWGDSSAQESRWKGLGNSIEQQFNSSMSSADQTDFGIYLGSKKYIDTTVATKLAGEELQRLEGQGAKPKTTLVSDQIQTPAGVMKKEQESNTPSTQQQKDEQQIAALMSKGDIKVLPTILSIFANTLVSTMVKNYQEKGTLPFGIGSSNVTSGSYDAGGVVGGRQQAQQFFSSILDTAKVTQIDTYDLAGQLNNCPDEVQGIYNCRADADLVEALKQTESGNPLTIGEALLTGKLHKDFKLIPPDRKAENTDKNCFNKYYCYGNIKVLRQVRILPLGFEIAALNSDPDKPWTLGQVVGTPPNYNDGFNNCAHDSSGKVIYDPVHKPFCHLIDPNWVMKLTETRCKAQVDSAQPVTEGTPYRTKDCADLTTCVSYDSTGKCSNYAYCTRESNTWKFDANSCEPQNRTCRTFIDPTTNGQASYLYRTLDTNWCTADNVGCSYYSLTQQNGSWLPPGRNSDLTNRGIYYNEKVSNSCSSGSEGCSAYVAATNGAPLYLRKAPDYLGCYDTNTSSFGIQWPETQADLRRLPAINACKPYAQACIQDEVGCDMYTPKTDKNTEPVPGKFAPENVCAAECVGYDSFREMPSNYSNGQEVAYVIPSAAESCKSEVKGCTGFTYLSASVGASAERVEYYNYLKPCRTLAEDPGKNFFTYEGTAIGGFQLKSYKLVANTAVEDSQPISANPNNDIGGPRYLYRVPEERAEWANTCNKTVYEQQGIGVDPDCRQFNDDQGNVYYRLLSKLIPVTNDCSRYRMNDTQLYDVPGVDEPTCTSASGTYRGYWDGAKCQACFENGIYQNGQCYYDGLPGGIVNEAGVSGSCQATDDSCREYKGNAGNNIKIVSDFPNNFENASVATAGWEGAGGQISVSQEATVPKGHSLQFNGLGEMRKNLTLTVNHSYTVTFWAKGTGPNSVVRMESADGQFNKDFGQVGISDTWNFYQLGPLELASGVNGNIVTTSFKLAWILGNNGSIFLDNVNLVEVTQDIYLKKNSIKISPLCDDNADDNLPGAALGCKAYTNASGNTINLTGFSFLCRNNAINCTAVLDTQNTPVETGPRLYKVWVPGTPGMVKLNLGQAGQEPTCSVPVGQTGCYLDAPAGYDDRDVVAAGGQIVSSTIYILADTPTSSPVYLVASKDAQCSNLDLGCTFAGKMISTPAGPVFQTTTIKNDPSVYTDQLCTSEALSCKRFTDDQGGDYFFKDPQTNGQKICTYQTGVNVKGTVVSGWFWKSVGACANKPGTMCTKGLDCGVTSVCSNNSAQACGSDANCSNNAKCVSSCQNIGSQPCYPNYLSVDGEYGLWSYGVTSSYQGFVGECPAEQNKCTEFIDHGDNDRPWYLIKDSKITAGDCNGLVSQKNGCALFQETSNPNNYWDTGATYKNSNAADGRLVDPVQSGPANDANIIIKVKQDRVCAEWLQCISSHVVKNADGYKNVCDEIGRCDKAPDFAEKSGLSACAHYVKTNNLFTEAPLSVDQYVKRDVAWGGEDYSGYSILGLFPVERIRQLNVNLSSGVPQWRLVKPVPCGGSNSIGGAGVCVIPSPASADSACVPNPETDLNCGDGDGQTPCAALAKCGTKALPGVCTRSGVCVTAPDGTPDLKLSDNTPVQICRAYPEKDSPFPFNADVARATGVYGSVNKCNEGNSPSIRKSVANACECDYTRAEYGGNITKFWNFVLPNTVQLMGQDKYLHNLGAAGEVPSGICQGGDRDGWQCSSDQDCHRLTAGNKDKAWTADAYIDKSAAGDTIVDGACQLLKTAKPYLGWRGYCLEEDLTTKLNNNPDLHPCLTWYPVDALNGASDINNQHPEAGFNNPPQYFCLNSSGVEGWQLANGDARVDDDNGANISANYLWHASDHGFSSGSLDPRYFDVNLGYGAEQYDPKPAQFWRVPWPSSQVALNAVENKIYQQDIEKISLVVIDSSPEDPPAGSAFEIWPNDAGVFNHANKPQAIYKVNVSASENSPGYAATGPYMSKDNEFILFYGSNDGKDEYDPYATPEGNICFTNKENDHQCTYNSGSPFKPVGDLKLNGVALNSDGFWDQTKTNLDFCKPDGGGNGDWFAFRIRFDLATRKLTGYDAAYCNNSSADGHIAFHLNFKMRELCRAVSDARVSQVNNSQAVAWTDRLWKQGQYSVIRGLDYAFDFPATPAFGSLRLPSAPNRNAVVITPFQFPYQKDSTDKACAINGFSTECACPSTSETECKYSITPPPQEWINAGIGAPYSCNNGVGPACARSVGGATTTIDTQANNYNLAGGKLKLGQIFSRVASAFAYIPLTAQYSQALPGNDPNNLLFNKTYSGDEVGILPGSPIIRAPVNCVNDKCQESLINAFDVNGTSTGNVYIYGASSRATVRFFAAASKNQMPLREIRVDWGDGSVNAPGIGSYRNQRGRSQPRCDKSTTPGTCGMYLFDYSSGNGIYQLKNANGSPISCTSNNDCPIVDQCMDPGLAPNFGLVLGQTCDNNLFQFDHDYLCVAGEANYSVDPADCGNIDLYPNGCCKYTIRVKVKDNWGWCSGSCTDNGVANGCYDGNDGTHPDHCTDSYSSNSWLKSKDVIVAPSA